MCRVRQVLWQGIFCGQNEPMEHKAPDVSNGWKGQRITKEVLKDVEETEKDKPRGRRL
jgi:hypothetical protein